MTEEEILRGDGADSAGNDGVCRQSQWRIRSWQALRNFIAGCDCLCARDALRCNNRSDYQTMG